MLASHYDFMTFPAWSERVGRIEDLMMSNVATTSVVTGIAKIIAATPVITVNIIIV